MRHPYGGQRIKIKGQHLNVNVVRIIYVCEVCHAKLHRNGHGLRCTANPDHRGFIHRNEAARIQKQQNQNIEELEQFYKIENGRVICQS